MFLLENIADQKFSSREEGRPAETAAVADDDSGHDVA